MVKLGQVREIVAAKKLMTVPGQTTSSSSASSSQHSSLGLCFSNAKPDVELPWVARKLLRKGGV